MNNNNNNNINNKSHLFVDYIIIDIFTYLSHKATFKDILEYSLLSKRFFFIFRNIITYQNRLIEIRLPLISFKKYIETDIKENNSNYKRKLLQYKNIENLQLEIIKPTQNNSQSIDYYFIKKHCSKIKKIHLIDCYVSEFSTNNFGKLQDYTKKGLVSIEKLIIDWCLSSPISDADEFNRFSKITNINEMQYFPFSFSFIKNYNPRKVQISTSNSQLGNDFFKIDSLLNYKSIESLNFKNIITPNSLIKKVFSGSNIKSFTILLDNIKDQKSDDDDDDDDDPDMSNEFIFLNQNFKNNNYNLKKLIIRNSKPSKFSFKNEEVVVTQFLNQLSIKNIYLKTIGLEFFNITNPILLELLFKFTYLTTIHCNNHSISSILQHCNSNPSIKTLKYYLDSNSIKDEEIQLFKAFFETNKSLQRLYLFYYYPHLEKQIQRIKNISNNNNNLNIIIKEYLYR